MQNRKFFTSLAAAFALTAGLASCSNNDEELDSQNVDGRTPITLTSNVATRAASQDLQNTQIESGVKVGVFVTQDEVSTPDINNHLLTADGSGGFTGETMYFPEGATSVNIYAYAPYNSDWNDKLNVNNVFTVPADQSTEEAYCKADLMIGTPNPNPITPAEQTIQLNFKHKLAKLNLDFNQESSQIDLKGATVSILNVLPEVSVNVGTGEIGQAAGTATTITAAEFADEASTFEASAVFAPQTISSTAQFVQVVTADEKTFTAPLNQTVEFKSGKKYTYTVQFVESGDGEGGSTTEMELVAGSVVEDWEDGMLDQYTIGDYVTKDGQIIKNADAKNAANKADIVAVIFSKEVSETDAAAGYDAYAMGLTVMGSKAWKLGDVLIGEEINDFAKAFADLDGLSKTRAILASTQYTGLEEDAKGNCFVNYSTYKNNNPLPTDGRTSEWFTPSFGQMVQIFNNLGDANLTVDMTLVGPNNYSSAMHGVAETTVLEKMNEYVAAVKDGTEMFSTNKSFTTMYATVTEQGDSGCWGFSTGKVTINSTDYAWGFGRNCSKSSTNLRNIVPCVAIKLPTASIH